MRFLLVALPEFKETDVGKSEFDELHKATVQIISLFEGSGGLLTLDSGLLNKGEIPG